MPPDWLTWLSILIPNKSYRRQEGIRVYCIVGAILLFSIYGSEKHGILRAYLLVQSVKLIDVLTQFILIP